MPDCELKLKVEATRSKGKVWKYTGVAMVNDKIMADSEWMATIVDRND
jgi:3-hydroxyacyl-[acyl-carrier-protein] dehydratase